MPAATPTKYSTIGSYRSGVWLVSKNGEGAVVNKRNLPAEGSGFEYYWLGSTPQEAEARMIDAVSKLGIRTDISGQDLGTPVQSAFSGHIGGFSKAPTGILGAIKRAVTGGIFVTGPLGGAGALEGSAAAGGADAAAGAGAGAGAAAGAGVAGAAGLAGLSGLLANFQLFTNLSFWKGIGLILAGAAILVFAALELKRMV